MQGPRSNLVAPTSCKPSIPRIYDFLGAPTAFKPYIPGIYDLETFETPLGWGSILLTYDLWLIPGIYDLARFKTPQGWESILLEPNMSPIGFETGWRG